MCPLLLPRAFGLLLVSCSGVCSSLKAWRQKNEYQDSQLVANAKEEAWEVDFPGPATKGRGRNSLPVLEGLKAGTGAWSASSDTALEITMEHPASLYLWLCGKRL
ncbi:MAG: hypothetical protein ACLU9T_18065 [Blautia faecis]